MKSLVDQRAKNMKVIQDKMKLNQKEVKRFNPVSCPPIHHVSLLYIALILA